MADTDNCEYRRATEEEIFFADLGDELYKNTIAVLNDHLKQLITLSSAFVGGSILLGNTLIGTEWKLLIFILFFLAIISAVIGSIPTSHLVRRGEFASIRDAIDHAIEHKEKYAAFSLVCFLVGMLVLLGGAAVHSLQHSKPQSENEITRPTPADSR